jgi:uncharacterized membrane protein YhhN
MSDVHSRPPLASGEVLFVIGAALALSHLADVAMSVSGVWGIVWKAGGIFLLGVYALLVRRCPATGFALLASSAGDALLDLSPPQWIAGMAAFGVAHLFYLAVFMARMDAAWRSAARLLPALTLALFSAALLVWFWPDMGDLRAPGAVYQIIITAMAAAALAGGSSTTAKAGAVLFVVSDTLLALGLYRDEPAPAGSVWLTYALAQICLARALTRQRAR